MLKAIFHGSPTWLPASPTEVHLTRHILYLILSLFLTAGASHFKIQLKDTLYFVAAYQQEQITPTGPTLL